MGGTGVRGWRRAASPPAVHSGRALSFLETRCVHLRLRAPRAATAATARPGAARNGCDAEVCGCVGCDPTAGGCEVGLDGVDGGGPGAGATQSRDTVPL